MQRLFHTHCWKTRPGWSQHDTLLEESLTLDTAKGLCLTLKNRIFTRLFDIPPSFVRQGFIRYFKIAISQYFTRFFDMFAFDVVKPQFFTSFCRSTFISCERVASRLSRLPFVHSNDNASNAPPHVLPPGPTLLLGRNIWGFPVD